MIFEPVYKKYKDRLISNIKMQLVLLLIYLIIAALFYTQFNYSFIWMLLIFLIHISLHFKSDKIYLKQIEISSKQVNIHIVSKDQTIMDLNIPLQDISISIERTSTLFNQQFNSRHINLEINQLVKGNQKFIYKQAICHHWDEKLFNEIIIELNKTKTANALT